MSGLKAAPCQAPRNSFTRASFFIENVKSKGSLSAFEQDGHLKSSHFLTKKAPGKLKGMFSQWPDMPKLAVIMSGERNNRSKELYV